VKTIFIDTPHNPTPLQDLLEAFPDDAPGAVEMLEMIFGLPALTRCSPTVLLYILARQYNYPEGRILEIGTHKGHTAAAISWAAPQAKIITIDPCTEFVEQAKYLLIHHDAFGLNPPYANIEMINAYSWDMLAYYTGPYFDMIWVDGEHEVRMVEDLGWWNWLKIDGVMVFHDYYPLFPYVQGYVNMLRSRLGREYDVAILRDGGTVGFYKREGDPEWT